MPAWNEENSLGFIFCLLLVLFFFWVFFGWTGDELDVVNVRALGTAMCQEHGLTYDHRDLGGNGTTTLRIFCKNTSVEQIEDGYLLLN